MTDDASRGGRLPPRWVVTSFWRAHRAVLRVSGGRVGLWRPKPGGWGTLQLTTTGRVSGEPRTVVVGYVQDGQAWVTLAMNGWAPADPAWWLNLQATPIARIRTRDGVHAVRAREASGEERERLWQTWSAMSGDMANWAARRPAGTPVVVLEPIDGALAGG